MNIRIQQDPNCALLVKPAHFCYNNSTAASNSFQHPIQDLPPARIHENALQEFEALHRALTAHRIETIVIQDPGTTRLPDAIFPNNWISLHENATAILYPMLSPARRAERTLDILTPLRQSGFICDNIIDLTCHEQQNRFLEGTGSVIFDRHNKVLYAGISPRTDAAIVEQLSEILGYTPVLFNAVDINNIPIYHTNVIFSLTETLAILCIEAIRNPVEKNTVLKQLEKSGHEIIIIDYTQLNQFAGNIFGIYNQQQQPHLIMSEAAWQAFTAPQKTQIQKHGSVIHVPLPTIEYCGGGSARCMLAGIHLPRARAAPL